jgi:ribosomal protein L15E
MLTMYMLGFDSSNRYAQPNLSLVNSYYRNRQGSDKYFLEIFSYRQYLIIAKAIAILLWP